MILENIYLYTNHPPPIVAKQKEKKSKRDRFYLLAFFKHKSLTQVGHLCFYVTNKIIHIDRKKYLQLKKLQN